MLKLQFTIIKRAWLLRSIRFGRKNTNNGQFQTTDTMAVCNGREGSHYTGRMAGSVVKESESQHLPLVDAKMLPRIVIN